MSDRFNIFAAALQAARDVIYSVQRPEDLSCKFRPPTVTMLLVGSKDAVSNSDADLRSGSVTSVPVVAFHSLTDALPADTISPPFGLYRTELILPPWVMLSCSLPVDKSITRTIPLLPPTTSIALLVGSKSTVRAIFSVICGLRAPVCTSETSTEPSLLAEATRLAVGLSRTAFTTPVVASIVRIGVVGDGAVTIVGRSAGVRDGKRVGLNVGLKVGVCVSKGVRVTLGMTDGNRVEAFDGTIEGMVVGVRVGMVVGCSVSLDSFAALGGAAAPEVSLHAGN